MAQLFHIILYQPLFNLLVFFTNILPYHSLGLAIIVLTLIVRIVMLPSSLKAAHAQVKTALMQPRITQIKKEIKDQQEQSKAMMALYKEEGFSPFGSCLPLLIQFIILISLLNVFRSGLSGNNFSALYSFVHRPEIINTHMFGLNLTVADPWILPIAAAIMQIYLSWLMLPKTKPAPGTEKDPLVLMNKQMLFLPALVTVYFGHTIPAALVIYWITTTIFSIFQQLYVNKNIRKNSTIVATPVDVSELLPGKKIPEVTEIAKPADTTKDRMMKMMSKRLDKQEKKADVTITIREKKK